MKMTSIRTRPLAFAFKKPYHWAGCIDYGTVNVLVEVDTEAVLPG
jgi:hypothetical protein